MIKLESLPRASRYGTPVPLLGDAVDTLESHCLHCYLSGLHYKWANKVKVEVILRDIWLWLGHRSTTLLPIALRKEKGRSND